jgi:hypothetical protein
MLRSISEANLNERDPRLLVAISFRRYQDSDFDALERFNRRMEAGGSPHRLYREDLTKNPTADLAIRPINDSLYVAAQDDELRGGTWLREQYFQVDGALHRVGWMKYAIAESQVDARFSMVPLVMVRGLTKQQPRLMALGMGGHDAPFARLLDAADWRSCTVPFFFLVVRPFRVLRGLTHLRGRPAMRIAMDAAAWTGAGWLGNLLYRAPALLSSAGRGLATELEPTFGSWADDLWNECRGEYHALAVRDGRALDFRFPAAGPDAVKVHRVRVRRGTDDIGWVCAKVSEGGEFAHAFGDLRVGLLLDMLARPHDARSVLAAGVRYLEAHDVDIVVTNLSHDAWIDAARGLRFLSGPSNVAFYRAPAADELLFGSGRTPQTAHITRSDD